MAASGIGKKVHIATSREIGYECIDWAKKNIPKGFQIADCKEDCDIFISVLYDKFITPFFIKERTCFNFHPAVLPEYRGAGAYSWTLINGDNKCGITLHLIDEGIDTGDIIEIRSFAVDRNVDTAQSLFEKGNKVMFKMFKDWFYLLLNGEYDAVKQDESKAAIYYRKDLNKIKDLSRYIRGLTFEGKESAYYIDNNGVKKYINFQND